MSYGQNGVINVIRPLLSGVLLPRSPLQYRGCRSFGSRCKHDCNTRPVVHDLAMSPSVPTENTFADQERRAGGTANKYDELQLFV